VAKLKQKVILLEDELAALRRAGDDLFSSKDTAADIARLLADRLLQCITPDKARQVIARLPDIFAEREKLTRDATTAAPPKFRRGLARRKTPQAEAGAVS
jgi:hypothetical protein